MPLLHLIRHGEPRLTGVMLGQMDSPLSERGRDHAAEALGRIEVETVWTSPLRRATETAALIRSRRVVALAELREIDLGEWTGKTWAEVEAEWPDLAVRKLSDWLNVTAPGGETWKVFLERVNRAWNLVKDAPGPVAIVAHQGVNSALMHLIDNRDPLGFQQGYGEVISVEYD